MTKAINFIDKYILSPRTFKIVILLVLFVMQIPLVHEGFGGLIKYFLLFGILICIWDFIKNSAYKNINDKVFILLIAFAVFYVITILINRNNAFSENVKQLIYMVVFFWILFFISNDKPKYDITKEFIMVSWAILFITLILSLVSLLTYVLNISEWYYFSNGTYSFIGAPYGRLHGLYNSNSCGGIALVSILSSFMILFEKSIKTNIKSILKFILIVINISIQFLTLLLSQSRGSYYSLLITLLFIIFLFVIKNVNQKLPVRTIIACVLVAVSFFGIIKFSSFIQTNATNFIVVSDEDANNIEKDTTFEDILESAILKYFENSSALSGVIKLSTPFSVLDGIGREDTTDITSTTGRLTLWKAGFKVFLDNPVFGVTREGLVSETNNVLGYNSDSLVGGGLHNMYLTILVSSGIVGFITIGAAVITVLFKFLKVLFSKCKIDNYLLFSFAMVFAFLISELVENRILYQVTAFNAVFWIYFGYFHYFVKKEYDELKCNDFEKE